MKKPDNIKELCEFIWYLEDKYDLLDFEINGVKPWQADRIEIYYKLGRELGIFEKNFRRGMNKIEKIKILKNLLVNSLKFNPLKNLYNVEFLIFSHPRSKLVNGNYIDIYSYYFLEENKNKKFLEFEEHYEGKHIRKYFFYKRYLDFISLYRNIFYNFIKLNLNNSQIKILDNLQKDLYNLGINVNVKDMLLTRTKKFLVTFPLYKKFLEKTSPKEIYLVVSYGRAELIRAAKELKVKTIEFQHGTFSKYHLGYSYPNKKNLDYFPDEFWVWNEYWKNLIEFPLDKENIKIYPFKYLENEKNKYKNIKKNKNWLIVLGQGGLTDRMAKIILSNINFFKKFTIIFKLHPNEYFSYKNYKNLIKLQKVLQIDIVTDANLYELFAKSEYQAGVFSTALYEGVEFGCNTILFDLPGIEYMENFIEIHKLKIMCE